MALALAMGMAEPLVPEETIPGRQAPQHRAVVMVRVLAHAIPVMVPAEAMARGVAAALDQEAERVPDRVADPAADQEVALAVRARDLAVARVLAPAEVAGDTIRSFS
jgi:hypothetical protein